MLQHSALLPSFPPARPSVCLSIYLKSVCVGVCPTHIRSYGLTGLKRSRSSTCRKISATRPPSPPTARHIALHSSACG